MHRLRTITVPVHRRSATAVAAATRATTPRTSTRSSARSCGSTSTARPAASSTGSLGTNPYVGRTGRDEVWSRGLRNPWRFSFDRVSDDLWIGDVGQNALRGDRPRDLGQLGLRARRQFRLAGDGGPPLLHPVERLQHDRQDGCRSSSTRTREGCAVTGGYVYRGTAVPSLYARYVFADFCSGRIWTVAKGGVSPIDQVVADGHVDFAVSSFGEDEPGELYVLDLDRRRDLSQLLRDEQRPDGSGRFGDWVGDLRRPWRWPPGARCRPRS